MITQFSDSCGWEFAKTFPSWSAAVGAWGHRGDTAALAELLIITCTPESQQSARVSGLFTACIWGEERRGAEGVWNLGMWNLGMCPQNAALPCSSEAVQQAGGQLSCSTG